MVQATEIGKRIRKLRENQGLTREAFCQDGSQLSVRQLARIERGVSNPTMAKLHYISRVLGILLSDLVEQLYQELPRGYHVLKFQLFHQKTYKNRKLLERKRVLLSQIYQTFYPELPKEEKVIIDIFKEIVSIHLHENFVPVKKIMDTYFGQIELKKEYAIRELFQTELYCSLLFLNDSTLDFFRTIVKKLLAHEKQVIDREVYFLNRALLVAAECLLNYREIELFLAVIKKIKALIGWSSDFQYQPLLDLLEAKYAYIVLNDPTKARVKYRQARMAAIVFGDRLLLEKIKLEKKQMNQQGTDHRLSIMVLV